MDIPRFVFGYFFFSVRVLRCVGDDGGGGGMVAVLKVCF